MGGHKASFSVSIYHSPTNVRKRFSHCNVGESGTCGETIYDTQHNTTITRWEGRATWHRVQSKTFPKYCDRATLAAIRSLFDVNIHTSRTCVDHRKVRRRIGAEKCSLESRDPITKPDRFERRIRGCDERSYVSRETDERYKWSRSHKRASLRFHG